MDRQAFIAKVDFLVEKKDEERKQKIKREKEREILEWERMKRKFAVILEKAIDGAIENNDTRYVYEFKAMDPKENWWYFNYQRFLDESELSHKVSVEYQREKHSIKKYQLTPKEGFVFNFK